KSQAASSASAPPTGTLGLVACGPQERPRVLGPGRLLRTRTGLGQRDVEFAPRLLPVDFLGETSLSGQDRYPVVGHGQEPAADRGAHRVGVVAEDLDQAALGQHAEHRRMTGQHPDVALRGLGDHRPGLAGPQLAVRHHQRYSKGHRSSSLAFFSTSSIPPTMWNACSGRLSTSPALLALNDEIVSSIGVKAPGWPVNCSATYIGWDRNRSIRLARCTVILSSSPSSSTPRMAMMSCSSRY